MAKAASQGRLDEKITEGLEKIVAAEGIELVHAEWHAGKSRGVLRLFIDRPAGVTIDDCELVSRLVGAWLDVEDPFPVRYNLEVASPGLDRLFYSRKDYERFAGRKVRTSLLRPVDGQKLVVGRLRGVAGETVSVVDEEKGREYNFGFPDIRWTRLEIEL